MPDFTVTASTIERVEARTVLVPLATPTALSTRLVTARHFTLVRVVDSDGAVGIGFAYAGSLGGNVVTEAVRELVAPVFAGQDALRVRGLWNQAYLEMLLHGRAGAAMRALSAVDIAVWDLNSRRAGLPLWQYLGGAAAGPVPVYAGGGYNAPGKTVEDLAAEMRGYRDAGFTSVKMKIGAADAGLDEERVAAVREAIGPDVKLMMDANNAWRDLGSAVSHLRRLERYNPYFIEEPFLPDDVRNHARLRERTPYLVAAGEILQGLHSFKTLLDADAADIVQPDAAVCGGITEYLRVAALADAYGVQVSPHWFHELHVHLVAALPNSGPVEYLPDASVFNFQQLIDQKVTATGGYLPLPTRPGLGFDFAAEAVDALAVDQWR